jgi:hypothetical protein
MVPLGKSRDVLRLWDGVYYNPTDMPLVRFLHFGLFMLAVSAFPARVGAESRAEAVDAKETAQISVLELIRDDFEPSSFAPGFATFNLPGSHLSRDTAAYSFEAVVIPRLTLYRAGGVMLQADPVITLRRFDNIPSNPVRTPDYKPRATLYYSPVDSVEGSRAARVSESATGLWYLSFSWWHHSNGEEGGFGDVREDGGALNDVDGSFSLWGASAELHRHFARAWLPRAASLRLEWFFMKERALGGVYPDAAVTLSLKTARFRHPGVAGFAGWSRLSGETTWRLIPDNALHETLKPDPFSFSAAASYAPDWRPAFLPFPVRTDYYNMNFNRSLRRVDFGVMANP